MEACERGSPLNDRLLALNVGLLLNRFLKLRAEHIYSSVFVKIATERNMELLAALLEICHIKSNGQADRGRYRVAGR
jgi:hypothetical protein